MEMTILRKCGGWWMATKELPDGGMAAGFGHTMREALDRMKKLEF